MKSLFIMALFLFGGVLSQMVEERKAPKCKNPKGKLWSSILDSDCGQSVCKKVGWRNATWEKCPRAATEEKLHELEEIVKRETRKIIEKVEEVCHNSTETALSIVTRLPINSGSWYVGVGYVDTIGFVPSKNIAIRGISLYRAYEDIVSYSGVIRLREAEASSKKLIISQTFNFTTTDSKSYIEQLFATPGNVKAGVKYIITLQYDGDRTSERRVQRGSGGVSSVSSSCDGESITFKFFPSDYFEDSKGSNGSGVSRGQIPQIQFTCSGYKKKIRHTGDDLAGNSNLE